MQNRLPTIFTKCDDDDAGVVAAVTSTEDTIALTAGLWKISAMDGDLLWKLGDDAVTDEIGSFLGSGDQEILEVRIATDLHFIRPSYASADGEINVVKVEARVIEARP